MRHLTYADRLQFEALYNNKFPLRDIAKALNIHISTVYREVKRGYYLHEKPFRYERRYSADIAQRDYDYKSSAKGSNLKLENDYGFVRFCETCILRLHWSPDTVIGFIRSHGIHFSCNVCTKTLYNYIDMGLLFNVTNKNLVCKCRQQKNPYRRVRQSFNKPLNLSIEKRPKDILKRDEFGHWEMDTVIGKSTTRQCLLVFTERQTRYEIVMKLASKSQLEVRKALNRLERSMHGFSDVFKTITVDNGCEFLNSDYIEKSCLSKRKRTTVYYCHPYSSSERGSNENANKLIRRFIPKSTPIENYSNEEISKIQKWINKLPRRILGYKSADDLVELHNIKLA